MKQKHLIEIPEEIATAILITRREDGHIGVCTPKGDPMMYEMMALTYGVFVSMLAGAEAAGVGHLSYIRDKIKTASLEEMRDELVRVCQIEKHFSASEEDSSDE